MGIFLSALLFIGPSYVANAAPLLLGGGAPLDGGRVFYDGVGICSRGSARRLLQEAYPDKAWEAASDRGPAGFRVRRSTPRTTGLSFEFVVDLDCCIGDSTDPSGNELRSLLVGYQADALV